MTAQPEDLALATSPDGQWAAARQGQELVLFPGGGGGALGKVELATPDIDLALVGPPTALVVLSREAGGGNLTLYTTPYLEAAARLDLDGPGKIAAITGARLAVMSADAKHVAIVRSAGRALATQKLDVTGPVEFIVGLERNQLLFGLPRKLEVWDGVSGRPLLRAQFQLPPPPRVLGSAAGHLWATTTGSEDICLYRLSDGRPFRHYAGAPITDVVCHPASPVLVLVTPRGLVRLHAYAHSLTVVDGVPAQRGALALHVLGEDITLVGFTGHGAEPWRLPINGSAVVQPSASTATAPTAATAAPAAAAASGARAVAHCSHGARWRETLAAYAGDLVKGAEAEAPTVAIDNELGELAHRLALAAPARRALAVLYALHLIGEPALPIASLARALDDWAEPLGQGELGALAMLRKKHGKVSLRRAVTDLLDGLPPRSVRLAGSGGATPRAGAFRLSRDSRTLPELETALVEQLGRIAIVEGPLAAGLLEARLHGATAVLVGSPPERPRPWPRDASLVLVLYGTTTSWVADLPALAEPPTA